MNNSLVSIIIPVFNRADVIKETLESVIRQTHENWELLLIDDGSTDSTRRIVNEYCITDLRIKLHDRPVDKIKGANSCRNYGFLLAKGQFINWFDSDDIMGVDFIREKLIPLYSNQYLDFCCCISSTFKYDFNTIETVERPTIMYSDNPIEDYILNGLYFYTNSPLWRKSFLDGKVLFDETLFRSQERDFHFRILLSAPKYLYLNKILFFKRIAGNSISNSSSESIVAQMSVFTYFDKVFSAVMQHSSIESQQKILEYIFYRQAVNIYNIATLSGDLYQRIHNCRPLAKKVIGYAFTIKILNTLRIKLILGLLMSLMLKKGYSYLYYPQFNHRKYNE